MAKPDRKQTLIRIKTLDREHYARTDRYARQVDNLYKAATREYSQLVGGIFEPDPSKPFSFADYPETRKKAAKIAADLAKSVERVIEAGQRSEWIAATYRANTYMGTIIDRSKLTRAELEKYEDRNMEGLAAFQGRKVQGLGLSQRVWKVTDQFTGHVELALDVAIGDGRSAEELSRDVRGLLKEPNKLFRRVRDKYGNLRLSKAAAAYHPGRGFYRSSYQNAMRLARTEINMAYRTADWERWQREEFVVGFRIGLSNNHTIKNSKGELEPLTDICDELAGDYPKTFKFVGWHPNCRCVITPILKDPEEMHRDRRDRLEAIMNDEEYKAQPSAKEVNTVPEAFSRFIDTIAEQSKGWKSQPYWIRVNFKGGTIAGGLSPSVPHTKPVGGTPAKPDLPPQPCTEFDAWIDDLKKQAYSLGLDISQLDPLRAAGQRAPLKAEVDRLRNQADDHALKWSHAGDELRDFINNCPNAPESFWNKFSDIWLNNIYNLKRYFQTSIDTLKKALADAKREWAEIKAEKARKEQEESKAEYPITFSSEQIQNNKDLAKALNVNQGEQMSQKAANEGKENPNYKKGEGYRINCQTCTVAHYLRRLGFDVEAKPNIPGKKKGEIGSAYKELDRQGLNWKQRFLNPDGTDPDYQWSYTWASSKGYKRMTDGRVKEYFKEHLKADGIYEVYCAWKGGSAHVFLAEVRAGKIQYFDPQTGEKDVSSYLSSMKGDKIAVLRIDDKIVNPKIKNLFIPK